MIRLLGDEGDLSSEGVRIAADGEIMTENDYPSLLRPQGAVDDLQQGGFPCAIRPDDGHELARLRLDGDAPKDRGTLERDMDVEKIDRMVHQPFSPLREKPARLVLDPLRPQAGPFMSLAIMSAIRQMVVMDGPAHFADVAELSLRCCEGGR